MIVFEAAAAPAVRTGESLVAGRRLVGRLLPYGTEGDGPFRFDPVDRRFALRRRETVVLVGPSEAEPWSEALARLPAGPVLVGPCSSAENVRGAYRAAAEAALRAGRAVYLLDPAPEGIPEGAGGAAVVLCSWRPGPPAAAFPGLATARAAGLASAAIYPLVPGWTGEPAAMEALAAAAKSGGAASLTAIASTPDGEARRGIVEARAEAEPAAADAFFEVIHHGAWTERMAPLLAEARASAARHGMAFLPPRPVGRGERPGNAAASARLEELADAREAEEHRAALAHAAVRWIDDAGRDLAAVAREGNFRKVFPFGADLADAAEAAFRETR